LWLTNRLARREESLPENSETMLNIPLTEGNGIRFFPDVIVVNSGDTISAFSSKCTHLGCRINQAEGDEIVCPCHGSRFNQHGQVLHGPAMHGLQPLDYSVDRANAVLHVNLIK
jgi:Rieske Fe-S protein